jgi:hypothetical protein
MPASPAQLAANRANALKSTGPNTAEGKAVVRWNALKHGLRSDAAALPNEDPAAVAARNRSWNEFYDPRSPEAQQHLNECVRVTLLSDRLAAYNHANVSQQVFDADLAWENACADEVQSHVDRFRDDPEGACAALVETAAGCRWLVLRWEALLDSLNDDGKWNRSERSEAVRLMGCRPGRGLKRNPEAWEVWLLGALMPVQTPEDEITRGFQPDRMPESLRARYRRDDLPRYTEAARRLKEAIAGQIDALNAEAEHLHETVDLPGRAAAAERAMVLEGDKGRLFLRYHSEVRNTFHRACRALKTALQADQEAALAWEERASEFVEAFSPNKPDFDAEAEADRPENSTQVVAEMPVEDSATGTPVGPASAEVAPQFANVDRQFAASECGEGGAALFYWGRATCPTSPYAVPTPVSGPCHGFEPGSEAVPGAPVLVQSR